VVQRKILPGEPMKTNPQNRQVAQVARVAHCTPGQPVRLSTGSASCTRCTSCTLKTMTIIKLIQPREQLLNQVVKMSLLNHKSFIASYLATAHLALRVNGTSSSLINLALILQGQIAPPQPFPESPSNSAGSLLCNVHLVHLVQLAPHFAVASKRHNHPFARATRAGRATRMPAQIAAFPCANHAIRLGSKPAHHRSAKGGPLLRQHSSKSFFTFHVAHCPSGDVDNKQNGRASGKFRSHNRINK
jgi:hypothetical protein